jgi:hypothetical protein
MYEWVTGNAHTNVVRIYPNNLTLNTSAAIHFSEFRYVTIGIDRDFKRIAIKPIPKRDIDLKLVPLEHLHRVSIGNGYGKISNKMVCDEIASLLEVPLDGQKFLAKFDKKQQQLIVDLNQPLG